MSLALRILMAAITIIQAVIGITLNTFILSFSFENMKKQPTLNPTNVIYFNMGLVNVFMQMVQTSQNVIYCFWYELFSVGEMNITLTFLMLDLIFSTYWLTGWLCVYYCVNINNFTHQLIIGLKRVLLKFLKQILLLSAVGSLILSVLSVWLVDVVSWDGKFPNGTWGSSTYSANIEMPIGYRATAAFLGCCLPFVIALISTGVTALSLIKHIITMKQNISALNPNLQALTNATRTMVLFLVLSVIFYIGQILCFSASSFYPSDMKTTIGWIILISFPSAEGVIITQATPKLKKKILDMFCSWRNTAIVND